MRVMASSGSGGGGGGSANIEVAYTTRDTSGWQPIALATKDTIKVYDGLSAATGDIISITSGGGGAMTISAVVPCTIYYAANVAPGTPSTTTEKTLSANETFTITNTTYRTQAVIYAVAN